MKLFDRILGRQEQPREPLQKQPSEDDFDMMDEAVSEVGQKQIQASVSAEAQQQKSAIINKLQKKEALSTNMVLTYCDLLNKTNKKSVIINDMMLPERVKDPKTYLNTVVDGKIHDAIKDGKELIHIPFILERKWTKRLPFFVDHIVVLTINVKEKCFEYYDSKGKEVENETRKIDRLGIPTNDFYNKLVNKVSNRLRTKYVWTAQSNNTKHQRDHYNCGVFVSKYMAERESTKFNDYCNNKSIDPKEYRKTMVDDIKAQEAPL